MKKFSVLSLVGISMLAGCATPDVMDVRKIGDKDLSCSQIAAEIAEANRFEAEARKEGGMTGTNVAAGVFFWPALLVTANNVSEAKDAARDRKDHLIRIAEKKNCKI